MVGLQGDGNLVFEAIPTLAGIDHGVGFAAQVSQDHHFPRVGQPADPLQDFLLRQVGALGQGAQLAGAPLVRHAEQHVLPTALGQQREPVHYFRHETAVPPARVGVHHLAAPQGILGGADDEQVPLYHGQRVGQENLDPSLGAGVQPLGVQQPHPGGGLAGEQMKSQALVVP